MERSTFDPVPAAHPASQATRSLAALILGFRFFALAAVSGSASFIHGSAVSVPLVVAGVLGATVTAVLQHVAFPAVPERARAWLVWGHVAWWTLLIHATGGQGSPLALGYLLELPLSGALFGRKGVMMAALASIALYVAYSVSIGSPFEPGTTLTLVSLVLLCAAITWQVVGMLERQRTQIEVSRTALADRAERLAEELRRLGDSLGDALVTIDETGRIANVNPSGALLLGVHPSHSLGKPWQEVLNPDPVSRLRLMEVLESGAPQRDVTMVLSPFEQAPVTVRAGMWRGGGRDAGCVHLLLDPGRPAVSDDPVRRLGESAACVAHQIRNSMHSIQGLVGTLGSSTTARPGQASAEECLGALQALGGLAEDMLAMAGASRARPERVAIQDVLRSAIVLLGQPPIRLALPASLVYVETYRSQLVHAVFNLLDNAVNVNPPGEPVTVQVEHRDQRVIVDISDRGPGIPAQFTRGSGPLPSRRGAGLGLLAARRFVEACGGDLSLDVAERGGTRCHLELPAAPALACEPAESL